MNTEFLSGIKHCTKGITFTDILNIANTWRRQLLLLSLFWYEAIKAKGKRRQSGNDEAIIGI